MIAGALGAAWVLPVRAQGTLPRIGFLGIEPPAGPRLEFDAFLAGLHKLGYAEGRNLVIEVRFVGYDQSQLARAA